MRPLEILSCWSGPFLLVLLLQDLSIIYHLSVYIYIYLTCFWCLRYPWALRLLLSCNCFEWCWSDRGEWVSLQESTCSFFAYRRSCCWIMWQYYVSITYNHTVFYRDWTILHFHSAEAVLFLHITDILLLLLLLLLVDT